MKYPTLPAQSNQETWDGTLSFIDDDDGLPLFTEALPPSAVTLRLRDRETGATVISGSMADGALVVVGDGEMEFTFSATAMSALEPKTYDIGLLATISGVTKQLILGSLPVLEGL